MILKILNFFLSFFIGSYWVVGLFCKKLFFLFPSLVLLCRTIINYFIVLCFTVLWHGISKGFFMSFLLGF